MRSRLFELSAVVLVVLLVPWYLSFRGEEVSAAGDPRLLQFVTEVAKLHPGTQAAGRSFGDDVAVSGDTIVIGAAFDAHAGAESGAVYVFAWNGTAWTEQARLVASDAEAGDRFGTDVSINGDTIVVGALRDDNVAGDAGAAYVFVRSGTTWTEQIKLLADDVAASRQFGKAVSIHGDTVVVGAWQDGEMGSYAGAAYVFHRNGTMWGQQAKLTASDPGASDFFGFDVSVSGDTAVVGAIYDDDGASGAGSAYVFQYDGMNWSQAQKLTASDIGDSFGCATDIDGDTIVIGSYTRDVGGVSLAGTAYVFARTEGAWSEQQRLSASDASTSDQFGWSVAISGNIILVGAITVDDSGFAYLFTRDGGTWTEQQKLVPADAAAYDESANVAIDQDVLVVGAPGDDDGGEDSGSAYVYAVATQGEPELVINYGSGAPGSFFTVTASNLAPNSTVGILVNGQAVGMVDTSLAGGATFILSTEQADEGSYAVTTSSGAAARLHLDAAEPLRAQEGTGPVLPVPAGIAYTWAVYLPLVSR